MRVDTPGVGPRFPTVPRFVALVLSLCVGFAALLASGLTAAGTLPSPEQFIGFTVGSDNRLVRWDKIVEYMRLAAGASDRVRMRELGKTSGGNAFIALEISSPDTLQNLDRYKRLERKLYFQGGAPARSSATRSSGPAKSSCSSRAAFMQTKSAPRRWRWSWSTASRPTIPRR